MNNRFEHLFKKEVRPVDKKDLILKEKNKEVKDQILQAAKVLFSSRGYDGTTVRQICDEANVSLALVSYHFGGKENVFNALFEPLRHTFMNAHYDVNNSLEALRSFCRNFVLYRIHEHELIDILQQEIVMNSPRLEMLKDVFLPSWEQLRTILQACLEQQTIHFDSIDIALNFIMGTLMYSLNNPFLNRSALPLTPEQIADLAVDFVLNGLQTNY
ncbi:TetR/AcrR family transcriptional regulator [Lysinibacillus fusiformis]|uniref:TetR/AcrR family transcriptional regulator n=1 Tax=Lysinibacillus fusiformis TaxID=28031 RepID=UPI0020BF6EBF|nr:TetR/AcrR family transcriptional regulator [Lysinibacillus fusiformis]